MRTQLALFFTRVHTAPPQNTIGLDLTGFTFSDKRTFPEREENPQGYFAALTLTLLLS